MSCGVKQLGGAKQVGGAAMAPLSYLNPSYREPSSSAGPHALHSEPGLARPSINATGGTRATGGSRARSRKIRCTRKHRHTRRCLKNGGFYPPPSLIGSFMRTAPTLVAPALVNGYRMVRNYKGPSKNRTRKN